jgi:hypothetical protein
MLQLEFQKESRVNFSMRIAIRIQLGWWPAIIANSDRACLHDWKLPVQPSGCTGSTTLAKWQ